MKGGEKINSTFPCNASVNSDALHGITEDKYFYHPHFIDEKTKI